VEQPFRVFDRRIEDDVLVDELLQGTSRTFALAIPLLKGERRRQIGLSYLLFRVADSIEDAAEADVPTKVRLLLGLREILAEGEVACDQIELSRVNDFAEIRKLWPADLATHKLLSELPRLLSMLNSIALPASAVIRTSLSGTIDGMTRFMDASQLSCVQIKIETLSDLQSYCYVVAGIVGEMLTDLFVSEHAVSDEIAGNLRSLSVGFGECLQLTNILKDADRDVVDGRVFIPAGISRDVVIGLAFRAADLAQQYICLLKEHDFPDDIVAFCRFLWMLAEGTLNRLRACNGTDKLTREEVMLLLKTACFPSAEVLV